MSRCIYHDAILGTSPPMEQVTTLEECGFGHWVGGFVDDWRWNDTAIHQLNKDEAKRLYYQIIGRKVD